ncbi:hypothetical protein RHMOL_Rhmol07G0184500 [Rhododendron molle]|uniref:Uncharacterized protein n=1 Tax=Rhododendron molle TaxID=49168 RepID=A0ACC0N408_RHOML|nr:hypothetical protein RHMOL_Rhmol07G0184500 [Rhododendron molle]
MSSILWYVCFQYLTFESMWGLALMLAFGNTFANSTSQCVKNPGLNPFSAGHFHFSESSLIITLSKVSSSVCLQVLRGFLEGPSISTSSGSSVVIAAKCIQVVHCI